MRGVILFTARHPKAPETEAKRPSARVLALVAQLVELEKHYPHVLVAVERTARLYLDEGAAR